MSLPPISYEESSFKLRIRRPRNPQFLCLALLLSCFVCIDLHGQLIATVAGGGPIEGRVATQAGLGRVSDVKADAAGNLYIADFDNHRIRRVDAISKVITTIAGNGTGSFSGDGGPAMSASLLTPYGVAVDTSGNVFIADSGNNRIRRVDAVTGIITTVAGTGDSDYSGDGSLAIFATLDYPAGVAVDSAGDLYISDTDNDSIRRVDATTKVITTVAGNGNYGFSGDNGPATAAMLSSPYGVAVTSSGTLYIADTNNSRVRRVDGNTKIITTVAGNGGETYTGDGGPATAAALLVVVGVAVDASGNLYLSDSFNHALRRVDAATNIITTIAGLSSSGGFTGDGGPSTGARLNDPSGLTIDAAGSVYVADLLNDRIRKIDAATKVITTVAGDGSAGDGGSATAGQILGPSSTAVDGSGNLYIAEFFNDRIRKVDALTGSITTVAGGGDSFGDGGLATAARLSSPNSVIADARGNLFIADTGNSSIRKVDATTKVITTVAGIGSPGFSGDGGPATAATLSFPSSLAFDASGNLYIADSDNDRIRRVDATTQIITTVAGSGQEDFSGDGGPATTAAIVPLAIAVDASGNLYIAGSDRIRKVDAATHIITTVAGSERGYSGDGGLAALAQLNNPSGIAVDASGNLFIADTDNSRIRRVDHATGIISTLAGNGDVAFSGDFGPAATASLAFPEGLSVDASGIVYIADTANNRVRAVFPRSTPRRRSVRR